MAVIKPPPPVLPKPVADIVRAPKEYAAPVVDTRTTNYNTLSTFASGYKWACDIFLKIDGRDDQPTAFSEDTLPIYGQYKVVRGFELLVNTTIDPKQGTAVGRHFESSGSAACYSVVTPSEGCFFIADVGDGRNGLFTITASVLAAPFTEAFTTVQYRQIALLSPQLEAAINSRVVETFFFDRELLRQGITPLIREADIEIKRKLTECYRRLSNVYIHEFFDTQFKTLILPGQVGRVYDPFMTRFVLRTFDKTVCNKLGELLELTVTQNPRARVLSVLDAIENLDDALLYSVGYKVTVAAINNFKTRPYRHSIYYSGINYVISLYDTSYTVDTADAPTIAPIVALEKAGVKRPTPQFLLPSLMSGVPEPTSIPAFIKRVVVDDYYIFSEAFYQNLPEQSLLEHLVRSRISGKTISMGDLLSIASYADKFDNLERFYYIPIILALIKTTNGIYT